MRTLHRGRRLDAPLSMPALPMPSDLRRPQIKSHAEMSRTERPMRLNIENRALWPVRTVLSPERHPPVLTDKETLCRVENSPRHPNLSTVWSPISLAQPFPFLARQS